MLRDYPTSSSGIPQHTDLLVGETSIPPPWQETAGIGPFRMALPTPWADTRHFPPCRELRVANRRGVGTGCDTDQGVGIGVDTDRGVIGSKGRYISSRPTRGMSN